MPFLGGGFYMKWLRVAWLAVCSAVGGWQGCLGCLVMGRVGGGHCLLDGGGRLVTAYRAGNRSASGILSGNMVNVQSSAMGKYARLFSGCLSLCRVQCCMNSGHFLSQLVCVSALHDMQYVFLGESQLQV